MRAVAPGPLLSPTTSQAASGEHTDREPTCLTPAWQRRHLWRECSKKEQSPGDCCGPLSWPRSYRCCELCREKRKGKPFTLSLTPLPSPAEIGAAFPPPPSFMWLLCGLQVQLGSRARSCEVYKSSSGLVNSTTHPGRLWLCEQFHFRGGKNIGKTPQRPACHYLSTC